MTSGSNRPPKKKTRRGGGGGRGRGQAQAQALLPSLAAFLLMDNNETHVEDVLVEEYVRRYMRWPEAGQERAAGQLMACIDAGNVTVVRAVMLATLEMDGWDPKTNCEAAVECSVPPSPDGALPPGAMPVRTRVRQT